MSRAAGPRAPLTAGDGLVIWCLLAVFWGLVGLAAVVWLAARIAAAATGGHIPAFGTGWVTNLVAGRTARTWPGTPTWLVATVAVATGWRIVRAAAFGSWQLARHRRRAGDPVAALHPNAGVQQLTLGSSAQAVARLRPSLAGIRPSRTAPSDVGLVLGELIRPGGHGPAVYASWEDTLVAFMAPRSGKTTTMGVPFVLSAPGPVVATSIKADLWAATAQIRARTGTTWVFDPQRITLQPRAFWWDPLAGLTTVEEAHRMASHFVLMVADSARRDLWGPAAQELLCALMLAAAASARSLRDVARWLDETGSPTPAGILDDAGFGALASSLRGAQHGAPETRDGIYQTARTAAACLHDEQIMAWVTPPAGPLPIFNPAEFAASRDTLYLLSESRAAASPLIAALTDRAMRAGRRQAELSGGRLDPPMVLVLDEAANICRIGDLPDLYSHLGSRGMVPITILQSYQQGVSVWGEPGMAALWGAATRKVIGSGIDDPRLARDLAVLVGQHDVPIRSVSYGDRRASEQISLRRQDILQPADVRALPPGTALLLATGARPALIRLRPWYATTDAPGINAAIAVAQQRMRQAAASAPADNPSRPSVDAAEADSGGRTPARLSAIGRRDT